MDFSVLGELYYEVRILQREKQSFEQLLRKKDEEIALLRQKLQSLKEPEIGQRQSDK